MLTFLATFPLVAATLMLDSPTATWLLVSSQLLLLLNHVRTKQVTGTGAFLFMSFLFFGVRAIYLVEERDFALLFGLFRISADIAMVNEGILWATAGMLAFSLGSAAIQGVNRDKFAERSEREAIGWTVPSAEMTRVLLVGQVLTVPIMLYIAGAGRSLYNSPFGAYAYDLPVPLQSVHLITLLAILARYLDGRRLGDLATIGFSAALFLYFTWLMREVTLFRGFYVAGVMVAGLASIMLIKGWVGYAWLILPVVLLQPLFQTLGGTRQLGNEQLAELGIVERTFGNTSVADTYWEFYNSRGDMNILDTFVAARNSDPRKTPYLLSWLYAPVHIVPRALWPGKPERGVLQDVSFTHGAPYAPGIAGFFWLDGGNDYWMILCMFLLGGIVGYLDGWVLSMRHGYLKCALVGILAVNCMFLTRFFLWQALWQALYAVIPILILHRFLAGNEAMVSSEEGQSGGGQREGEAVSGSR